MPINPYEAPIRAELADEPEKPRVPWTTTALSYVGMAALMFAAFIYGPYIFVLLGKLLK